MEFVLVQLIKKGGLRERANRSRKYSHSENNMTTLAPHKYVVTDQSQAEHSQLQEKPTAQISSDRLMSQEKIKTF